MVVTSQSEIQRKLLKSTAIVFIIYLDNMSYVKLWSLLSSSALISANHSGKLVTLHLLTKDRYVFFHNIAWWAEEMFAWDRNERLFNSLEMHRLTKLVTLRSQKIEPNFNRTNKINRTIFLAINWNINR